jgi:hypothetical protein
MYEFADFNGPSYNNFLAMNPREIMEADSEEPNLNWYSGPEMPILKEGFDTERFVEPPRKDFQCPICLGVVRNPLECSQCGSLLCKKCACSCSRSQNSFIVMSSSAPKFNCPICRTRAPPREPSSILKKIINNLMIFCKNKSYSCTESHPLGSIKQHQKECKFKAIRCANHTFCNKEGNKTDFITVEFKRSGKSGSAAKSKLVCSEICRKIVLMDYYLRSDQLETAVQEYKNELDLLNSLQK